MSSTRARVKQAVDGGLVRADPSLSRRLRKCAEQRIDRGCPAQCVEKIGELRRWNPMCRNARARAIGCIQPFSGEGAERTELAWQTWQKPCGPDVWKKPDADFGHGENELVAGDPM